MAGTYGRVTLTTGKPKLTTTAVLIAPARSPLPRPKYDAIERFGFYDLPKYTGQEPFELIMALRFENNGSSVEADLRALERMAERPEGQDAPPDVEVTGPIPHATLRWRITGFDENNDRTKVNADGDRVYFVVTVTLVQRVTETALAASLSPSKKAAGIGTTTKVKRGEGDLYDVAQRYYRDSSYALAISKANPVKGEPMPLGAKLRAGQTLRMP